MVCKVEDPKAHPVPTPLPWAGLSAARSGCSTHLECHRGWGTRSPSGQAVPAPHHAIEALQEVLEKLKSKRVPHYEKKFGQVPMCDAGEQCAVRKGARIGKLCDCPRGTSCNSFLLKCL
uniref:Cocaine- and amphetamine-regulated transcript protein n=1 Tax=Gallus gallus TaxID=9031 RepID=A0A8V0Y2H7_CHICK